LTVALAEPVDVLEVKFENPLVERTIKINYCSFDRVGLGLQAFFPKMSITEPVLSSFAGTNPPNPVLAVMSGNPELDPFNFSFNGDFLTKLLVTSGIELILLNMKLVFKLGVVEFTNPIGELPMPLFSLTFVLAVASPTNGPFITNIFLLFFTKTGEQKLKIFPDFSRFSVLPITDLGAEKIYLAGGLVDLGWVTLTLTSGTTFSLVFDPLEQVELS